MGNGEGLFNEDKFFFFKTWIRCFGSRWGIGWKLVLSDTELFTLKWLIVCYVKMVESENVSNKSKNVNWYSSSRKKFGVSSKNKKNWTTIWFSNSASGHKHKENRLGVAQMRWRRCPVSEQRLSKHTQEGPTHRHHQMANTQSRLIIFFAATDGEALHSQQKQNWELTVAQIMNSLLPIQT